MPVSHSIIFATQSYCALILNDFASCNAIQDYVILSRMKDAMRKEVSCSNLSEPISRVLSFKTTIYLGCVLPHTSSRLPAYIERHYIVCLFVLALDGVYQAMMLPPCWCALTAPSQLFS